MLYSKCYIKHTVPGTLCTAAGASCEMFIVCIYIFMYLYSSSQMNDQMRNVHIDTNSLVNEEKISEANHFICSGELAKLL